MNRIDIEVSGGCQCGAVRYHATQMLDNAHLCHCRMCQKAVGNIFISLVGAPVDALTWTRGRPAVWRSSEHVERGFCANCGTPLFYNDITNDRTNLTTGSFDHPEWFPPRGHDGIEGRMPWLRTLLDIPDNGTTEEGAEEWAAAIRATTNQHPDHDTSEWPQERE